MYKCNNRLLRYQTMSKYKFDWLFILGTTKWTPMIKIVLESAHQMVSNDISYII